MGTLIVKRCWLEYGSYKKYLLFGRKIYYAKLVIGYGDIAKKKIVILEGETRKQLEKTIEYKLPILKEKFDIQCPITK